MRLVTALTLTLCTLTGLDAAAARAADDAFSPLVQPEVQALRAERPVKIDGILDEGVWSRAPVVTGFSETYPGNNTRPQVRTRAQLAYDDSHLYVAFICQDDPAALRATLCQRDQFFNDDAVGVYLDTFGEAQWAYGLFVNPYGIQKDLMWTSVHGEDRGFDMIWHSAARIGEDGYVVEMAIPFAGMRFPTAEAQTWRLDLVRSRPRESDHQYGWSARDRDNRCGPCQWGRVTGVRGVTAGKGLEVLTSLTGSQLSTIRDTRDPESGLQDDDVLGSASVGFKYSVTSDVTAEATINPDFSQIEADAAQIDVNSTIFRRYAERRPFFQEGNDLFRTYFNSFYTRMVVDPEVAAKGTARWTKTSLAYMYARDESSPYIVPAEERSYTESLGRSDVHVLRGLHSLGNGSQAGAMITHRSYEMGGEGLILSGDASVRLSNSLLWLGQYVYSDTEEPDGVIIDSDKAFKDGQYTLDLDGESYSGDALITELRYNSEHLNFTLDYNHVAPTYRTQTGYDPWNDQRNGFARVNYNIIFDEGLVERITPGFFVQGRWNYDGERKWRHYNPQVDVRLRWAQANFGGGYTTGHETWDGIAYEKLYSWRGYFNCRPSNRLGLWGDIQVGENPALFSNARGDEIGWSLGADLKPLDNLTIEPTIDYIRSEDDTSGELLFKQTIARARVQWQIDRRLSLRLVFQHNASENPPFRSLAREDMFPDYHMYFGGKWEVDPLLTYRLNSFSVFYLGSTHDWRDFNAALDGGVADYATTSRQYFMKLQYLFQI